MPEPCLGLIMRTWRSSGETMNNRWILIDREKIEKPDLNRGSSKKIGETQR